MTQVLDKRAAASGYQQVTANLDCRPGRVRTAYLEGRKHYVVPTVILTEGVHNGSNGPLYYPPEELAKTPAVWNARPIVIYHPQVNGQSVSAGDKHILESRKVGIMLNTRFVGNKLKTESWLDCERLGAVDRRVLDAVEAGKPVEVSTGLFTDNEGPGGDWHGERYATTARNYRPDHLAILPDQKGSCSIADGAGLNMNTEQNMITNEPGHLDDASPDELKAAFASMDEESAKGIRQHTVQAIRHEDAAKVARGSNRAKHLSAAKAHRTAASAYEKKHSTASYWSKRANAATRNTPTYNSEGDTTMNKQELVDAIITNENSGWGEDDREFLTALPDARLAKVAANTAPNTDEEMEEELENDTTDGKGNKKPGKGGTKDAVDSADPVSGRGKAPKFSQANGEKAEDQGPIDNARLRSALAGLTADEYIDLAPPGVDDMLRTGMAAFNAEKGRVIDTITANKANQFSEAFLQTKSLDELRALAALASTGGPRRGVPMFGPTGGDALATNASMAEPPLEAPTMNFGKDAA